MNHQPHLPDPSVDKRLLANLRHARLEMEEVGIQIEEVIAKFDKQIRQQRLKRVQNFLKNSEEE